VQEKYLQKLEYNKILEILSNYTHTYIGKDLILNLKPLNNKDKVEKLLNETEEAVILRYKKGNLPISDINNIEISIKNLEAFNTLSSKSLLDIGKILKLSRELKEYLYDDESFELSNFPILDNTFSSLYSNPNMEREILSKILDENSIDDRASSKLYSIRKEYKKIEQDIKNKLENFIHSSSNSKYIQEPVITIRNDRYVIPIKEEYRSFVKGIIHDVSSSGSTVFIEPSAVFDLNNKSNNLKIEENIEIEKILSNLSKLLFPITSELENNIRLIGRLDLIFAKANYSIDTDSIKPIINEKKNINLINARHPLIDNNSVIPININLGDNFNSLVITGPNTGGKTVTLKTVGLLSLMACSGIHIPVKKNSSIYVFDKIFTDIGDEQSIQESLSTFSSHILNIIKILENATSDSLILVDELCSGTDPSQGSSLAISILENFFNIGALTIATTHYPEIKKYVLVTNGFENASCEFDLENLKPTYKLHIGIPGQSNAFEISKRLGLNDKVLDKAKTLINNQDINIEELLQNIYNDKVLIEKEKEEINKNLIQIESLKESLQKDTNNVKNKEKELINNAKIEARNILLEAKETASEIIKKMNKINTDLDNNYNKNLNNLRNDLNDSLKNLSNTSTRKNNTNNKKQYNNVSSKDLKIGMDVYVNTLMQEGIITSIPNNSNQIQIQIGSMKTNIDINNITILNTSNKKNNIQIQNKNFSKSKTISNEINVIGQNVEDSIFIIDKYLDDSSLSNLNSIRIVHGKGTGKLREGIHLFLKKNPHVHSFRLGTFGEGEMGVTVVELK